MIYYRFDLVQSDFGSGVCRIQLQLDWFTSGTAVQVMFIMVKFRIRVKFGSSSDKTYLEFVTITNCICNSSLDPVKFVFLCSIKRVTPRLTEKII